MSKTELETLPPSCTCDPRHIEMGGTDKGCPAHNPEN